MWARPWKRSKCQTPATLIAFRLQHLHHSALSITSHPFIYLSIHPSSPHLRPVRAAGAVCQPSMCVSPLLARACLCVCVLECTWKHVRGSRCMSWPPPACRFMLLIGCMSLYTTASHDWSHRAALVVTAGAVTAPRRTDGGSDKKAKWRRKWCAVLGGGQIKVSHAKKEEDISPTFSSVKEETLLFCV